MSQLIINNESEIYHHRSIIRENEKLIVVYNFKGGVGKTLLSLNLSEWISKNISEKVLLVDLDGQCNLTSLLNNSIKEIEDKLEEEDNKADGLDEIVVDAITEDFIAEPCNDLRKLWLMWDRDSWNEESAKEFPLQSDGNVFFLPGTHYIKMIESWITDRHKTLKDRFALVKLIIELARSRGIRHIIVDLNPGDLYMNQSFLHAASDILIPTTLDHNAVSSTYILLHHIMDSVDKYGEVRSNETNERFNRTNNITSILINRGKYRKGSNDAKILTGLHRAWLLLLDKFAKRYHSRFKNPNASLIAQIQHFAPTFENLAQKMTRDGKYINVAIDTDINKSENWKFHFLRRNIERVWCMINNTFPIDEIETSIRPVRIRDDNSSFKRNRVE